MPTAKPKFRENKLKQSHAKRVARDGKTMTSSEVKDAVVKIIGNVVKDEEKMKELAEQVFRASFSEYAQSVSDDLQGVITALHETLEGQYKRTASDAFAAIEEIRRNSRQEIVVSRPDAPETKIEGVFHKQTRDLIQHVQTGNPVLLIGPTQSSKSYTGAVVAKALGVPFSFISFGPTTTETKLLGYTNAVGSYVPTELFYSVRDGHLFMGDEMDVASPAVHVTINNGISNRLWAFPVSLASQLEEGGDDEAAKQVRSGIIEAHPNFRFIGSMNTLGRGADMDYVGRQPIDASTLARFDKVIWEYDDGIDPALLENESSQNQINLMVKLRKAFKLCAQGPVLYKAADTSEKFRPMSDGGLEMKIVISKFGENPDCIAWLRFVQLIRVAVMQTPGRAFEIISTATVIRGANLLAHNCPLDYVIKASLINGMSSANQSKLKQSIEALNAKYVIDSDVSGQGLPASHEGPQR